MILLSIKLEEESYTCLVSHFSAFDFTIASFRREEKKVQRGLYRRPHSQKAVELSTRFLILQLFLRAVLQLENYFYYYKYFHVS